MKILINGYYRQLPKGESTFSGPRNFVAEFLRHLEKTPHQYTAIVLRGKKQNNAHYTTKRFNVGKKNSWLTATLRLNTNDVFNATKPKIPQSTEQPKKILQTIIKKENPDVVILLGMSISNWYLLQAARELHLPIIVNHLGLWYKEITGYNNAGKAGIAIMNEMERDMSRYCTKEIFLTELSYRHLHRQLTPVSKQKYTLLPLPYDPNFVNATLPKLPKSKTIHVGIVARWDPIKNHEAVLALAKLAKKQGRDIKFYAVTSIRGDYPWYQSMREEYPNYIEIVAPMTPKDLKKFYQKMDVFILPSRFDVSPGVVLEAALQNRMTIISPTVGWVDAYKKNGLSNYVQSFKNKGRTLDLIEAIGKTPPPKSWITYLLKTHEPKLIFKQYLNLAENAIKSVKNSL